MDSECMIRDDQGVTEEWIVRVDGKEYGPANIDTLHEWKAEGRVLPANEARLADAELWTLASEIPGLFDVQALAAVATPPVPRPPLVSRSFVQILAETFRIYARGFLQFLPLTLLIVLPAACGQLAAIWTQGVQASDTDLRVLAAGGFAFLMFILSLAMWPIYVAGVQFLTAEIAAGRRTRLGTVLNEAVKFWPRVAALSIFVFFVFALLMLFALGITLLVVAGASSLLLIFLALGLLVLQVWMFGRFFYQRALLAAVRRARKCRIYRFVARKQKSRSKRTRASLVSTAIVARRFHCVSVVCICAGDRALLGMADVTTFFQ